MTTTKPLLTAALLIALLAVPACGYQGTYTCVRFEAGVGELCDATLPCTDGTSCVEGTCVVGVDHGAACDATRPCLEPYECEAGTCAGPRRNETESCDPEVVDACGDGLMCLGHRYGHDCLAPVVERGERCVADGQCPAGQGCVRARCDVLPARGESCTWSLGCADGLTCVEEGVSSRVCELPPRAEGDLCGHEGCPDGLRCMPDARGRACRAQAEIGDPCDGAVCAEGSYCSRTTNVCEPVGDEGDACTLAWSDGAACVEGLACQPDGDGHRCAPPVGEGESCRDGQVCGEHTSCDRDRPAPELGFCNAPGC